MVNIDCHPLNNSDEPLHNGATAADRDRKTIFKCEGDTENLGKEEWFTIAQQVPPHSNVLIDDKEFRMTHEPWTPICFSDEGVTQCKNAQEVDDPRELERIAFERTKEIEKEENWGQSYYYPPTKSEEPYGFSVFTNLK